MTEDKQEIIGMSDIIKWQEKKIPDDEILHLAVICGNCNHKDLLNACVIEFLGYMPSYKGLKIGRRTIEREKIRCPKCQSQLIVLNPEYSKNNLITFIKNE